MSKQTKEPTMTDTDKLRAQHIEELRKLHTVIVAEVGYDDPEYILQLEAIEAGIAALSEQPEAQDYPACSGNPKSCPENEGYGCCGGKQPEAQVGGAVAPVAWRIFWSSSPLSAVELTSDLDRVGRVRKLTEDVRVEPLYTTPPAPVVPEGMVLVPVDEYVLLAPVREAVEEWRGCRSPLEAQRAMFKVEASIGPGAMLAAAQQPEALSPGGTVEATRDEELPGLWSASDFTGGAADAQDELTEQQKADRDAVIYGNGFMLGGKHIPVQDVMVVQAPQQPEAQAGGAVTGETSDGYHTFNELYAHRNRLFSALMSAYPSRAWWSRAHFDGTDAFGGAICGIDTPAGPATYHVSAEEIPHLPASAEIERGKEWDGHTSADVLNRLLSLTTTPPAPSVADDNNLPEHLPRVHSYDPSGARRTVTIRWSDAGDFVSYVRYGDRTNWGEVPPANERPAPSVPEAVLSEQPEALGEAVVGCDYSKDDDATVEGVRCPCGRVHITKMTYRTAPKPAPVKVPEGWRITRYTGSFGDGKWEVYAPCGSGGAVGESDIRHFAVRMLLDHLAAQHTKEN